MEESCDIVQWIRETRQIRRGESKQVEREDICYTLLFKEVFNFYLYQTQFLIRGFRRILLGEVTWIGLLRWWRKRDSHTLDMVREEQGVEEVKNGRCKWSAAMEGERLTKILQDTARRSHKVVIEYGGV